MTEQLTPMMKQYMTIKEQVKDCILFFRLGDFYEMFFDDAIVASKVLELVLTKRQCGLCESAPMCGVPYHAALSYISKLVSNGYKVAICEQVEDPATAKGIVKREIVKIYTPGTIVEEQMLDQKSNNYIMCIYCFRGMYGISSADVSTGEMYCTTLSIGASINRLADEVARYSPKEVIINEDAKDLDRIKKLISTLTGAYISTIPEEEFDYDKGRLLINEYIKDQKISEYDLSVNSAGALYSYIMNTQKNNNLDHLLTINFYKIDEYMSIDASSRRNLEITETMRDKKKKGSLLWVLDKTITAMGGRELKKWLEKPLLELAGINKRLDGVAELKDLFMTRSEIREILNGVYDIERLTGKISLGNVNARDLISLKQSLGQLPYVKNAINACQSAIMREIYENLDCLEDIYELIDKAIVEEPPISVTEGGLIKDGYNNQVDLYRVAARDGKKWLADYESEQKEKTGIKNLKIGYNRVFGYYLEVTKANYDLVPEHYIRKQTLANSERYTTEELAKIEEAILEADEKLTELEYKLFVEIRQSVAGNVKRLMHTGQLVAILDVLACFAEVADRENYVKPEMTEEPVIDIIQGRHPVVEKMLSDGEFVPNDAYVAPEDDTLLVITGPNMAGKSTYMRQVALIVLMAQAGCFVPAESAVIGIVDKLFTRVGASDDLASGQSTFMVEMSEVANILSNSTERSLLILDEIGRGTSTFDGLSIAWAVLEYILENIKSRTLFATHYHEITELEGKIQGVKNYCVDVLKKGDDIVFLRKLKRGGADGSYGIEVAQLAGIPQAVTIRAKELLSILEEQDISRKEIRRLKRRNKDGEGQVDLFTYAANTVMRDEIVEELKNLDVQTITPIEALNVLFNLHQKAMKRK